MSRSDLLNSNTALFASANSASVVYGFDEDGAAGSHPRPRGLFYIRFRRPILSGGENWRKGHGFFAKSVDLPNVTPQVEELNQYNKKRVIHTGIKYNPISVTFYDTVAGQANTLWNEYTKYYFGDFNHANGLAWTDDATSSQYSDPEKTGFGYQSRVTKLNMSDALNSQFFFEACEIYQVFGSTYIQTDIINPKISAYEPESLDYEDMAPLMIRMGLTYEGIVYHNDGQPNDLSQNPILSEVFSREFSGQVLDPSNGAVVRPLLVSNSSGATLLRSVIRDLSTGSSLGSAIVQNVKLATLQKSGLGGVLSRYGNFSFGNVLTQVLANTSSTTIPNGTPQPFSRQANASTSLFDDDPNQITSTLNIMEQNSTGIGLDDAAMGLANTLSNGTVQIGKKTTSFFSL